MKKLVIAVMFVSVFVYVAEVAHGGTITGFVNNPTGNSSDFATSVTASQKALQRHPGAMSFDAVATILGDLENAGFDGSLEIIYRAGRIVTLCKS